jgi:hypothetical protein
VSNRERAGLAAACAFAVTVVALISVIFGGGTGGEDASSAPAPADATVAELARAADAQHICYGWRLSGAAASQGSNLGAGLAVDSDPGRCPRWVELRARVVWTPESSESEDWAIRELVGSADLASSLPDGSALDRVGVTENALVDDPAETVLLGVLALPLLVTERGIAPPVPLATSAATPDPAALTDPGSDFWRDRQGILAVAVGLIVVAVGVLGVGWFASRQSVQTQQKARRKPASDRPGNRSRKLRRKWR